MDACAAAHPEELLESLVHRVAALEPPVPAAPGNEWHMALGALLAMGTFGLLTDEQVEKWEARVQAEAVRLGSSAPPAPGWTPPPVG